MSSRETGRYWFRCRGAIRRCSRSRLSSRWVADGHSFALETQGSISQAWFAELDWLILSPKPPSSGMTTDWNNLENCLKAAQGEPRRGLKIVVFDDADYSFTRTAAARHAMLSVSLPVHNPAPLDGTVPALRLRAPL